MSKPLVTMPRRLTNAVSAYFETSRFAQANFLRFDKTLCLNKLNEEAAKLGYTVTPVESKGQFKGVFKLDRASQSLRVSAKTLPLAEKWH